MAVWAGMHLGAVLQQARWDAEYFQPAYLTIATKLDSEGNPRLGTLAELTCSAFYPSATDCYQQDSGVPFIRCVDVNDFPIIFGDQPFERLPEHFVAAHKSIRMAKPEDLIISKVGSPCFASIIDKSAGVVALTRTVLGLRNIRTDRVDPYYLVAFLRCKYGFYQLLREREQQIQFQLTLDRVRKIHVFLPSRQMQEKIGSLVRRHGTVLSRSKETYKSAQQLLEDELRLDAHDLPNPVGYEVRLSEVLQARRWDSHCFMPSFLGYANAVRGYRLFERLDQLISPPVKGVHQYDGEEGDIPYASIKHVSGIELITEERGSGFVSATNLAKRGDLLLAITGATIGKIGIVARYGRLAFSGDLLRLRVRGTLDPHYLLVVLRSPIGQGQLLRWVTGSTNGHLAPRDVVRALIPRLGKKEGTISDKVREALRTRAKAECLLELAKRRVEELIENQA